MNEGMNPRGTVTLGYTLMHISRVQPFCTLRLSFISKLNIILITYFLRPLVIFDVDRLHLQTHVSSFILYWFAQNLWTMLLAILTLVVAPFILLQIKDFSSATSMKWASIESSNDEETNSRKLRFLGNSSKVLIVQLFVVAIIQLVSIINILLI